jgi:hypothetical protein
MNSAVQQIIKAFTPLANKLGQGAEALYHAYYRQTIISGIESLVISLIILMVVGGGLWFVWKTTNKTKKNEFALDDDDRFVIRLVAGFIALFIIVITVFTGLIPGLNHVINPTYYTIQNILSQL